MKTLKKTLCLVLAMVMVFGLCAVSASAKLDSYTDKDDITYAEAVDVMTGIGVLAGDARGFRPTDTITRAEAAKIIAYIMVGNAGQADALKAGSDPFSDVPASHWAAGYISYCATAGIIAGMGDGYHPSDNVTGLQFAKMLLCALGYGVNNEYTGADWAINVSRDALRLGVFDDNLAGANNNPATREECALYAFNVVAGTEGYGGIGKVSYSALLGGYIQYDALGGFGGGSSTGSTAADANKSAFFWGDFDLRYEETEDDDFGRFVGHHWNQKVGNTVKLISADYEDSEKLLAVYTTEVTGGDMYNLLVGQFGKSFLDDLVAKKDAKNNVIGKTEVCRNQITPASSDSSSNANKIAVDPEKFTKGETKGIYGTGNGVQTYVYGWTDEDNIDHLRVCIIDTYLAQVTKVVEAKGDKDPETTIKLVIQSDGTDGHTAAQYKLIPDTTYVVNTDEFEKDDYVLVTITKDSAGTSNLDTTNKGKVVDIAPAVTKESEVSKYTKVGSKVSIVADGETYVAAKNAAGQSKDANGDTINDAAKNEKVDSATGLTNKIVDGTDYILYIDNYGYLIATSPVAVANNYVYVAQWGRKAGDTDSLSDAEVLRAHVYYADGTNEYVTVDTKKGIFDDADGTKTFDISSVASWGTGNKSKTVTYYGTDYEIGLYTLTMEKGKAVLNNDTDKMTVEKDASAKIYTPSTGNAAADYVTKGQAYYNGGNGRANANTVFFYVKNAQDYGKKTFGVTVYTGINSVPTVESKDSAKAGLIQYGHKDTGNVIEAALVRNELKGETSDIIYFFGGTDTVPGNSPNFEKVNDGTVSYKVYGGDGNDRVVIKYEDLSEANKEIAKLDKAGFVKVEDDKLVYVATTGATFNNVWDDSGNSKVAYVNAVQVTGVIGDNNDTLAVKFTNYDGDTSGVQKKMPLYNLKDLVADGEAVLVDLRSSTDKDNAMGKIDSVDDLITTLTETGADNNMHDLTVAMSFTGYAGTNNTNVVTAIYILGNVSDTTPTIA